MTCKVGPNSYYICAKCKKEHSPAHPFNRDAENHVGRKSCAWCDDNTPIHLDIVTGDSHERNR